MDTTKDKLLQELDEAEAKAIKALAGYKFQMFGYWSAIWVHLNKISGAKRPNPFKALVMAARDIKIAKEAAVTVEAVSPYVWNVKKADGEMAGMIAAGGHGVYKADSYVTGIENANFWTLEEAVAWIAQDVKEAQK